MANVNVDCDWTDDDDDDDDADDDIFKDLFEN